MTEHKPLPVAGYTEQSDERIALVNEFKEIEEKLLRKIDALDPWGRGLNRSGKAVNDVFWGDDGRVYADKSVPKLAAAHPVWLGIAHQHFVEGFMAVNRAVFQPQRIKLPEDEQ